MPIEWVSPLRDDDYAEYRDAAFLKRIGQGHLAKTLADFWPRGGPQWDALGVTQDGPVIVEAKAHLAEFLSPSTQASQKSRSRIEASFNLVRSELGVRNSTRWSEVLYQYANRLAFLWFLRSSGVNASLLFVGFLHDSDMKGPESAEVWKAAFDVADHSLGLPKNHALSAHVYHVFPDVRKL